MAASIVLKGTYSAAPTAPYAGQPASGPGGADYAHRAVDFYDAADKADGYWLFLPNDPQPDSAEVIVFLHGYGAYNPMVYGKWIKHLVAKGNIVIYPRYQKNVLAPRPDVFPDNAAAGIRAALRHLQEKGRTRPRLEKVAYIGHSYGGVIASHLGLRWQEMQIPKPAAMMLCEPGSGPFKGARFTDYSGLPADLNLLVVVGADDTVVGSEFGELVFNTAVNTPNRNYLVQRRDRTGERWLSAMHIEPYAYDRDFDNGVRNYTARRVLWLSKLNEVDFNCYWKLADALTIYTREGRFGETAFGNTPEQRFMGRHTDGRLFQELEVITPKTLQNNSIRSVLTESGQK